MKDAFLTTFLFLCSFLPLSRSEAIVEERIAANWLSVMTNTLPFGHGGPIHAAKEWYYWNALTNAYDPNNSMRSRANYYGEVLAINLHKLTR